MIRTFWIVAALCGSLPAHAADPAAVFDSGDWQGTSPDRKHFAALATEREEQMIWRKDLGTGLLEILEPAAPNVKFADSASFGRYKCFETSDRVGLRAKWSPDSRYLIITTASLGGHSPWHDNAFVYCADDRTVREMDEVVGLVVSPVFTFIGPHTVRLGIGVGGPMGSTLTIRK